MTAEELQAVLVDVRQRFHVERMVTSQRAKWCADDPGADPNTCRFCGMHWRKWNGSTLDGHAKCIVGDSFKRHLIELTKEATVTYQAVADACGVSLAVARSWMSPIRSGR